MAASSFKDRALGLLREANRRHVIVDKDGKSYVNLPLTIVIVAGLLAPWLLVIGVIVALATSCSMRIDVEPVSDDIAPAVAGGVENPGDAASTVADDVEDLGAQAGAAVEDLAASVEDAVEGSAPKEEESRD